MSDTESDQGRQITVSLSDPIFSHYSSSSDSDWTDTDSDTSSIMSGTKDKGKAPARRIHFREGSSSRFGEARANRGASASSSRNRQVPDSQPAAAGAEPTNATATQQNGTTGNSNPANSNSGVPGVQPYNNPAPISSTGQPIYTHYTGNNTLNQYHHLRGTTVATPGQPFGNPNGYITGNPQQHVLVQTPAANNMSGYIQQPNTGIHFQPQVPDTTNGPYLHVYHPRHDAQGQAVFLQPAVGAPVYVYQPSQIQALHQPTVQPVMYQMQAGPQAQTCHHTCYQYASVAPSTVASFHPRCGRPSGHDLYLATSLAHVFIFFLLFNCTLYELNES